MSNQCSAPGCNRELRYRAARLCGRCYQRLRNHGNVLTVLSRTNPPPYETLLAHGFEVRGECVLSRAPRDIYGYRTITSNLKKDRAHRVTWRAWFGDIPSGLVVDHECHNEAVRAGTCTGGSECIHRSCVNPSHLRTKTIGENVAAALTKRRSGGEVGAQL